MEPVGSDWQGGRRDWMMDKKYKLLQDDNKYAKEYELCIELAKVHFGV